MPGEQHGDGVSRGLEAIVYDRPVLETHWQLPIELPELPTILLQQTDGELWNNHFTRVVEDDVAHPAPGGMHSAHEQLVSTISHVASTGGDRCDEAETAEIDDALTEEDTRDERREPTTRTKQEGLDAFA